jgi:hypothetical protein
MPFKRNNEDAGGYPDVKRARLIKLSCTSLEDAEEIVGVFGNTTSSALSKFVAK